MFCFLTCTRIFRVSCKFPQYRPLLVRGNGLELKRRVSSEHQETLFHCEVDRAVVQVAQRLWSVLLGDVQKLPGRCLGHSVLDGPA